jgi:hypothetical protein
MFSMAHLDKLLVYVYLPQDRASQVRVGEEIDIFQTHAPDKPIKARVARTAGAIDTNTRTLQVDIEVPNANRALLPGAYVEAVLKIDPGNALLLPTNTLIFGSGGPYVAVVIDGKAEKKKVSLGIDYGTTVEIRSGVTANDEVILNPPDALVSGQPVVIETPKAPPAKRGS